MTSSGIVIVIELISFAVNFFFFCEFAELYTFEMADEENYFVRRARRRRRSARYFETSRPGIDKNKKKGQSRYRSGHLIRVKDASYQ